MILNFLNCSRLIGFIYGFNPGAAAGEYIDQWGRNRDSSLVPYAPVDRSSSLNLSRFQ